MNYDEKIADKVSKTLVKAGSTFSRDKIEAYERAISKEKNLQARWVMEQIVENARIAEKNKSPLCDDTGIPHVVLDVGPNRSVTGNLLNSIKMGVKQGLRQLPGRPMAVSGDDFHRIDQSLGIDDDPGALETAPFLIRDIEEDVIRLHIMMFGGGPAIRGKTYRVFHKHKVSTVVDEIVAWATDSSTMLGCTPCTLAVGIGRSHFEAASMMVQSLVEGTYDVQNKLEQEITERVNESFVGALGLGGQTTVLSTFLKIGPQRSSGVRIVCMRPCCCFEPRIASVEL